jgi:hypothetical protein
MTWCGTSAEAQTSASRLHLLQIVLQAAFPELQQTGNRIFITMDAHFPSDWTTAGIFHFRLRPSGFKPETETAENQDDQFLGGHAEIAEGFIEQLTLYGRHVRSRDDEAVKKRAQENPGWSDADLQKAIADVGGLYGPSQKEAFTRDLAVDRFREAFGNIQRSEVTFVWRAGRPDLGSGDVVGLVWRVGLQTIDAGVPRCPVLLFEPIGGKLVGIVDGRCGL